MLPCSLVDDSARDSAALWLINTCTVKSPSQSAMDTLLRRGRQQGKALLVAGCVPQGDRRAAELRGLSLLGVTQIDRVVEAVEETLKGHTVQLLAKKALPRLDLPKVTHTLLLLLMLLMLTVLLLLQSLPAVAACAPTQRPRCFPVLMGPLLAAAVRAARPRCGATDMWR